MRASDEHDRHNAETRRLLDVLEQKNRELTDAIEAGVGGSKARDLQSVLATRNENALVAYESLVTSRAALDEHVNGPAHFIRNYRVLDLRSGRAVDRFTVDFELAPWHASKHMRERRIEHYELQEQQPDGSWLSYDSEGGQ